MAQLNLEIISPNGVIFKDQCHLAVIPSTDGDIGAMYGHEMVVAMLKKDSKIEIFDKNQKLIKEVEVKNGGFSEMQSKEKLLILID